MANIQDDLWNVLCNQTRCYPPLSVGITIVSDAVPWTLNGFIEIIPANYVTKIFQLDKINIESSLKKGVCVIVLYKGLLGEEIEVTRTRVTGETYVSHSLIQTNDIKANSRISARMASSEVSEEIVISLEYHHINDL